MEARRAIIDIHTKQWNPPLSIAFKNELSRRTAGYCGADLKALCVETALAALRRRYPQIYESDQKLKLDVTQVGVIHCLSRDVVASIAVPAAPRALPRRVPCRAACPDVAPRALPRRATHSRWPHRRARVTRYGRSARTSHVP